MIELLVVIASDKPFSNYSIYPAGRGGNFAKRHNDAGGNWAFVDGHAAFFKRNYITHGTDYAGKNRDERFLPDVIWNPNRDAL